MKKLVSLVLALVMILSLSVTAFAAEDTLYLDISGVLDSNKTLSEVAGEVYTSMSCSKPVSISHVSGTIYSCNKTDVTASFEGEFWVTISYESGDNIEFWVVTSNMGDNNLYTPTAESTGTWSTYTPAPAGPSVTNGDKNVTGKYVAGAESKPIYKVDISWGSMAFTYTAASKGTWKTDSHTYEGATTAKWTWESGANEIKVTNHSNDGITVTPSYTKDNGYEDASMTFGNALLTLGTADNGENGAAGTATSGTITVTPGGSVPEGTSDKIGQITLSIAGANSSSDTPSASESDGVTTFEGLQAALNAGGEVKLGADITISSSQNAMVESVTSTLDLNGKTLSGGTFSIVNGTLTIKDSVGVGKIENTAGAAVRVYNAQLTIEGGTISGGAKTGIAVASSSTTATSTLTIKGGIVKGGDTKGEYFAISNGCTTSIQGGSVQGTIINFDSGTLTISNGTVSGSAQFLITNADSATTTITGGTIKGGVVYNKSGTLNISGGSIEANDEVAVFNYATTSTTISGGIITGTLQKMNGTLTITGGTFSNDPTSFVPEGYTVTTNESGTYTVTAKP